LLDFGLINSKGKLENGCQFNKPGKKGKMLKSGNLSFYKKIADILFPFHIKGRFPFYNQWGVES